MLTGTFYFPGGFCFFAGNLVPRGFWEREAYPVQSSSVCAIDTKCGEMLHFVGKTLRYVRIYGLSHSLYHWKGLVFVLWHF